MTPPGPLPGLLDTILATRPPVSDRRLLFGLAALVLQREAG
jgi:hypothetical protein